MERIPEYIQGNLLPPDSLNVLEIISFATPPVTNPPRLLLIEELFSKNASMVQNVVAARALLGLHVPNTEDIETLKTRALEAKQNGFISFLYPVGPTASLQLPFWVLEFWEAVHQVISSKALWRTAIQWIWSKGEIRVLTHLEQLPWKDTLELRRRKQSVEDIAPLCSERWLASKHMDLFGQVLEDQLRSEGVSSAFIMETSTLNKIIAIYRREAGTYLQNKLASHIRKLGDALTNGTYTKVAVSVSVRVEGGSTSLPTDSKPGNHWVTVILDIETLSILYGDSYKLPPPIELRDTLQWWLMHHQAEAFQWGDLPSSSQSDHFSCPIFSANTMAHALLPTIFPLMAEDRCIPARMDMLIQIVMYFRRSNLVSDGLHFEHEIVDLRHTMPLGCPWHIQCSTHTSVQIPNDGSSAKSVFATCTAEKLSKVSL
jgi:hypothetical protein